MQDVRRKEPARWTAENSTALQLEKTKLLVSSFFGSILHTSSLRGREGGTLEVME